MKLEQLKKKLTFTKKSGRPILRKIKIDDKGLHITDLETYLTIKDNFKLSHGIIEPDKIGLINASVDDGNNFPDFDFEKIGKIEKSLIGLNDLEYLMKFSSTDETRYYMNSIFFNSNEIVSLNGCILRIIENDKKINKPEGYIIPLSGLKILVSLMKLYKLKNVDFIFDSDFAYFENSSFSFKTKLINREYPRYKSVIPTKYNNSFKITNMIKMKDIKPLLNKHTNAVKIFGLNNQVYLQIVNAELTENKTFLIGECSNDFSIGFNMQFLEICSNDEKEFLVKWNQELSPVLWNNNIVMPLKI